MCPVEGPTVARGLVLLASHSVSETVAKLSAEGFRRRVGAPITLAIVRGMLTNPMVVGLVKWRRAQSGSGDRTIVSANERYRIVTSELWMRARKARGSEEV
ncbi:recombinase family protein [Bradyrhizobium sp. ORS 3257]|uniref:Recombinase domain-containing protein n=1 Tax=Bradyrhizobium vignae TaxID=1549949 RepID=A0A2U3PUM5_9BRAD|nr:protein of unknown function [Bradyrhizobium vignae]